MTDHTARAYLAALLGAAGARDRLFQRLELIIMTPLSAESMAIISMVFMVSVMDNKWLKVGIGMIFLVLGFIKGTR